MADLSTLKGIAIARQELYDKLSVGKISEAQANTMERVLRGQVMLRGQLPMQFLKLLAGLEGPVAKRQLQNTMARLSNFLGEGGRKTIDITPDSAAPTSVVRSRGR
jgi:hypothetical protein